MANITNRNPDDFVKSRPRVQAAVHGRTMNDEARAIPRSAIHLEPQGSSAPGTAIHKLFKSFCGFNMPKVPREPMREPTRFD